MGAARARLQNKEYAAVEVFRTPGKGCGLRTLQDLPKYDQSVSSQAPAALAPARLTQRRRLPAPLAQHAGARW